MDFAFPKLLLFKENIMRKFVCFIVLYLMTGSAFAILCDPTHPEITNCTPPGPPADDTIPEPEVLSLLSIGALAFLVARRIKK